MKQFISCDWGTSFLRLGLVEAVTNKVLAATQSEQGIAAVYALWKEQPNTNRITFYSNILLKEITLLEQQCGKSLRDLPMVLSGMASSSIGMLELPYRYLPCKLKNVKFETHVLPPSELFQHKIILISGLRSSNDVMRGEETILAGCDIEDIEEEQLYILPGTHCKHIMIKEGTITDFKTYMTGELFNLLSNQSILATSVEQNQTLGNEQFLKGVREAMASNLLNNIFHVRTNGLFGVMNKKENYHYLSGLLIGEELKPLQNHTYAAITVVSTGVLSTLYMNALSELNFKGTLNQIDAYAALVKGQALALNNYKEV